VLYKHINLNLINMENKTMALLKTKSTTIKANSKIEFNGEVYTHSSLSDHVVALHEARSAILKNDIETQYSIGKVFLQIQTWGADQPRKSYSAYLKTHYYSKGITQPQTSEYKFIAENYETITKLIATNKARTGQGCSYYRKAVKDASQPTKAKAKAKGKATSKGKSKVDGKITETLLAKSTLALVKEHGLDIQKLIELLTTK